MDYSPLLQITQLHSTGACSSVMMKTLGSDVYLSEPDSRNQWLDRFAKVFFTKRLSSTSTLAPDKTCGYMSFVTASAVPAFQSKPIEWLKELGFWCSEPTYNAKNATSPVFLVGRVPDIRSRLLEMGYNTDGTRG